MNRGIILDRDGTLTELHDGHAPWYLHDLHLTPFARAAVELARNLGYLTFIATNQPDVGGKLFVQELFKMNDYLKTELQVTDILCATTRDDNRNYKPAPGMLETFIDRYDLDRSASFMIGDTWKDIEAGHRAKLTTILVGPNWDPPVDQFVRRPDLFARDVLDAVQYIQEIYNEVR